MAVCAYALCYVPSEKARQDAQDLADQVAPRGLDRGLPLQRGAIALLRDLTAEAAITVVVVDEMECGVTRSHLPDGPWKRTCAVWLPSVASNLSWTKVSHSL
jgi:hypothetical protein